MRHQPAGSSPRPPAHRTAAAVLSGCCVLLLTFVATRWHPLLGLTGDVSRAKHRWAVREHGLTQVFRVPTDWVRDPRAMRLVCAAAAVRRHCD